MLAGEMPPDYFRKEWPFVLLMGHLRAGHFKVNEGVLQVLLKPGAQADRINNVVELDNAIQSEVTLTFEKAREAVQLSLRTSGKTIDAGMLPRPPEESGSLYVLILDDPNLFVFMCPASRLSDDEGEGPAQSMVSKLVNASSGIGKSAEARQGKWS